MSRVDWKWVGLQYMLVRSVVVRLEYLALSTTVLRHSSLFNVVIFFLYREP